MHYLITTNNIISISETSGTIQNTDQINKVEISDNTDFANSIILYPLNCYNFNKKIYVRLFADNNLPVEVRVVNFISGNGSAAGSTATDTTDTTVVNTFTQADVDYVFADDNVDYTGFSQADVDDIFTD